MNNYQETETQDVVNSILLSLNLKFSLNFQLVDLNLQNLKHNKVSQINLTQSKKKCIKCKTQRVAVKNRRKI